MEVSTQLPTQPHLFDRGHPNSFSHFRPAARDSYYSYDMHSAHQQRQSPAHAQPYYQPRPQPEQPPKVSLPSISDLLNFSRESDRSMQQHASQPRHEPAWPAAAPRSSYGSQLKVETSNIDPRLQRPRSPPMPSSAHPTSAPVLQRSPMMPAASSPAYARSADAEQCYYPEYPSGYDHQKRLSSASQATHSSVQTASSVHSSPDMSKSRLSSFSSVATPHSCASRAGGDVVPSQPAATSPRQRLPASPQSAAREAAHPYAAPAASHRTAHHYAGPPPAQRPTLTHQTSSTSIVTAASAGASRLEDRYVCMSCSKAFSRPSSLRIHSFSHTGEKPFTCPHRGCGKAFSVRSNMRRHERGCHVDPSGMASSVDDEMHSPDT